ncbi:MAG TPA: ABC transporter permease [Thermoanaerobaculia bacterium]|jgi:predicted permease|nr:ABC transporter permease [Thermoanaerobaculia bacterium]
MRRREVFGELRQDAAFALRQLAANPGFSLIAVLTLALGIGATTAIFSAVNAVVLRPLPVQRPERLVFVFSEWRDQPSGVSVGNYTVMAAAQKVFASISAVQFSSFNLSEGEAAERALGARVTGSFFDVFGVSPAIGRVFRADEDQPGREQVVVLSHRLWSRRFGSDPAIVGRDVRLNSQPYTVLGVMPPEFDLTDTSEELWVPIAFTPERKAMFDEHYLTVVARLRDGVSRRQAEQALEPIAAELLRSHPEVNTGRRFQVDSFVDQFVGDSRTRLLVLLGAVGAVLLIACGNVANLLLARSAARARELAIRSALGAGRGRIVRQLLTECAVLALISGALGVLLALWGVRVLVTMSPPNVPRLEQAEVDATALAFALALSLACSFIFGLIPALRAARGSVSGTLREGGRGFAGGGRDWLRSGLLSAEVALSVLLLAGAGLLIRSALELQRVRPGFDPAGVVTARIALPATEYKEAERVVATFERFAGEAGEIPGVRFAALSSQIPMGRGDSTNGLVPEGKPNAIENAVDSRLCIITPDYFRTLGIPIVRGRAFTADDRRGAQKVMIVNETLAAALFPGEDPIGRRVSCCEPGPDGGPDYKLIVGVARDLRSRGLAQEIPAEFYLPIEQAPAVAWDWVQRSMYLLARTSGNPETAVSPLRRLTAGIDPDVPLYNALTMEQRMKDSLATARFNTLLLTLLGCFGLLLAAGGIYGVAAYFVTQRTAEIGVRMALGATRRDVLRLVLWRAILPVAAGVILGLVASVAATRVLTASLVGVEPTDPLTLAAVIIVLVSTALLASAVPARRAASVDPTRALQAA